MAIQRRILDAPYTIRLGDVIGHISELSDYSAALEQTGAVFTGRLMRGRDVELVTRQLAKCERAQDDAGVLAALGEIVAKSYVSLEGFEPPPKNGAEAWDAILDFSGALASSLGWQLLARQRPPEVVALSQGSGEPVADASRSQTSEQAEGPESPSPDC